MFSLWQNNNVPIQQLAQATGLDKSTLTRMLTKLETTGHITRQRSTKDKRKTYVCLTPEYEALQNEYEQVSKEMISLYYQGFSEEEIDLFESYLHRIYTNLEKALDTGLFNKEVHNER